VLQVLPGGCLTGAACQQPMGGFCWAHASAAWAQAVLQGFVSPPGTSLCLPSPSHVCKHRMHTCSGRRGKILVCTKQFYFLHLFSWVLWLQHPALAAPLCYRG